MTKQEEKLTQKEDELKLVKDKLDAQLKRCGEYEVKFQKANEEKILISEQLQVTFGKILQYSLTSKVDKN